MFPECFLRYLFGNSFVLVRRIQNKLKSKPKAPPKQTKRNVRLLQEISCRGVEVIDRVTGQNDTGIVDWLSQNINLWISLNFMLLFD